MIRLDGRLRVLMLMAVDAACLVCVWSFTVWAYRALGLGHYKYGAEFYLRLWPVVLAYVALNAMFRLYHGSVMHPAAPVTPPEELRRLVGSSALTHLGLIAYLALAYQTTEHYSRAVIVISGCLAAVCPKGTPACIESIIVDEVEDAVKRMLRQVMEQK